MKVGRKVVNYDVTLTDKDINILIECIQRAKLDNFRHQNHAEALLEGFVKIFLDDNYEKYVNRYLELDIKDDKNYVFHFDPIDWAERLFETECNNIEDMPKRLRFFNDDDDNEIK